MQMSAGDVQRLFGRFTWGAYSPAGALERQGFFLRQLNRYRGRPWRGAVTVTRAVIYVVLAAMAIGVVATIAHMVLG